MASATVDVDLSKAMHEAERMVKGEIAWNDDYLGELIEFPGGGEVKFDIDWMPECEACGHKVEWIKCPECQILTSIECGLCEGEGGFWECPQCEDDDGELVQ